MVTLGVDVLMKNSFGSGDEEEMFSGKEYLFDLILNLADEFFLVTTLVGDFVELEDKDDTLVFAGDGGAGEVMSSLGVNIPSPPLLLRLYDCGFAMIVIVFKVINDYDFFKKMRCIGL